MLEENLHDPDVHNEEIVTGQPSKTSAARNGTKAFCLVNGTKCLVEFVGTCTLAVFYVLLGDKQPGILLGLWVIMLFGISISGGHFNPAVTLAQMFRKNRDPIFEGSLMLGFVYIAVQIAGGMFGSWISQIIVPQKLCYQGIAQPVPVGQRNFTDILYINNTNWQPGNQTIQFDGPPNNPNAVIENLGQKWISATISEFLGTFFFVFLFMVSTDKHTKYSKDKVVNCFIIAASYVAARLLSGGQLVTGINDGTYFSQNGDNYFTMGAWNYDKPVKSISTNRGTVCSYNSRNLYAFHFKNTGPLLNPGIGLGQQIAALNFSFVYAYCFAPIGGAICAVFFYDYVYVKSQEFLNEDDGISSDEGKDSQNDSIGGRKTDFEDEDAHQIDA